MKGMKPTGEEIEFTGIWDTSVEPPLTPKVGDTMIAKSHDEETGEEMEVLGTFEVLESRPTQDEEGNDGFTILLKRIEEA